MLYDFGIELSILFLSGSNSSKTPDLVRPSNCNLLISLWSTLPIKSSKDLNLPFFLLLYNI